MVFRNESTVTDYLFFADYRGYQPTVLSPVTGTLQNDRIGTNDCTAALGYFGKANIARFAVLRGTLLIGPHVMCPKQG